MQHVARVLKTSLKLSNYSLFNSPQQTTDVHLYGYVCTYVYRSNLSCVIFCKHIHD